MEYEIVIDTTLKNELIITRYTQIYDRRQKRCLIDPPGPSDGPDHAPNAN
jgi:hypothetical protein